MFHEVIGHTRDDLVFSRCENKLFRVSVDFAALFFLLFQAVQILEDRLHIGFILEKYLAFDGFGQRVHAVQTNFLVVVVKAIFVQMLDQDLSIFYVVIDLVIVIVTIVCEGKFVWETDTVEVLEKVIEVDVSEGQCA